MTLARGAAGRCVHGARSYRRIEAGVARAEILDLGVGQRPPRAPGARPAVLERADARPHQPRHRVADGLAHPPDLAVAALVDRDPQHAGAGLGDLGRGGHAVLELDAVAQPAQRARADLAAVDGGQVLLVDAVAGVGDAVGQLAVVRQQQEALGVGVEAADGEHPRLVGHQLDDGRAPVGVLGRRDDAGRLVQQVVDEAGLGADRRAVDLDEVDVGVDPPAEHGDLAVDGDPPGGDEVLAHPPAAPARATPAPSAGARRPGPARPRRSPTAPTAAVPAARAVPVGHVSRRRRRWVARSATASGAARPRGPRRRRRRG